LESFRIGSKEIGRNKPCFVVAEMGLGHEGSLGAAYSFVDAAVDAGADAVKFQTHVAEAEGTERERFRKPMFPQDATRKDYWKRTAFSEEQWRALKRHCDERRILFLSSPFSIEAVRILQRVGVPAWKVPSGETNNTPLLEMLVQLEQPILLSTGMSTFEEIQQAVRIVRTSKRDLLIYQCTNRYPCPPDQIGLNMIQGFKDRFPNVPIGLSDHSGRICTGIAAFVLGAVSIEVHVTFSRKCFGPDVSASITFEELKELVDSLRFLEIALHSPYDKDEQAGNLADVRALFTKSIVARTPIRAGTKITRDMLAFKKPGNGIPAAAYREVVGKTLRSNIDADQELSWSNLKNE